ncbi:MAG: RraA family protein [Propionibacteriales bacterium]|nr:RraA family protein [Propionibacteriales bacterium]
MAELMPEELDGWRQLPTATIADCLGRHNVVAARLRPVSGDGVLGVALGVRVMPGDSGSLHQALNHVPPGRVLVVDAGGYADRAVWGEVLTVAAQARQVRGLVLDGAVRDIAAIRRRAFPVYAVALSPAGPHKSGGGEWGGTVACGGAVVPTGDLVVGDGDGVVVVPWSRRLAVLAEARDRMATERRWLAEIAAGRASSDVVGL